MFTNRKIIVLQQRQQRVLDVMIVIVLILSVLGWSFAQGLQFPVLAKPDWLPQLPIVLTRDRPSISMIQNTGHNLIIPASQIKNLLKFNSDLTIVQQQIRRGFVKQLMAQGYDQRLSHPYTNANDLINLDSHTGYTISDDITESDSLDVYLDAKLARYTSGSLLSNAIIITQAITIPQDTRSQRSDLYFFKNQGDLDYLGYQIVSSRTRINKDKESRRFNIMTAFAKLGNILVLNPGQELSYLRDIDYDGGLKVNYKYGLSIIGDEEIQDYGGGICGSSTALYQGILTNKALDITKRRSHSRRYSDLYTAKINGELITTPGGDSVLYGPSLDLHLSNARDYPIIIIANYDGSLGGQEQVFSLGKAQDHGSMEFISSYKTTTQDSDGKTLRGGCYTWNINGELVKSCYKKVQ